MKKILTVILAVCMCLSLCSTLVSCNGDDWSDIFVFKNVTAKKTITQNTLGDVVRQFTTTETLSIADGKWSLERRSDKIVEEGQDVDLAYWDGSQIHTVIGSTLDAESLKSLGTYWFSEIELIGYSQNEFTEGEAGVFTADEVAMSSSTYKNVKVVIENNNLKSIEWTCEFYYADTEKVTQVVSVEFSNWGNTTVTDITASAGN